MQDSQTLIKFTKKRRRRKKRKQSYPHIKVAKSEDLLLIHGIIHIIHRENMEQAFCEVLINGYYLA